MAYSATTGQITAVLGPTNTGKTHLALERMMARSTGVIGLPLRLLAREIYDKVVKAKGAPSVALITGEEKIVPPKARFFVCTVEAMPMDLRPAFLAVDEIQLCSDPERGHVFTDRLLNARGTEETMFLGAETIAPMIRRLVPEAEIERRERFSTLSYSGAKKISKLPRRSGIVAFSAEDVYSIAELIRRQRGGAAVVMGALSPRTRNAQVELYQSGEVDYLIATDAIGMGLNIDIDHVAFASFSKFDGRRRRKLFPGEIGQIAGRAGRFRSDGTFGETADARPLDAEIIHAVENHEFDPVGRLVWRNHDLDLRSLESLSASLNEPSPDKSLDRVRSASDEAALEIVRRDPDIRTLAATSFGTARLWDVCCLPDFRKVTLDEHARLVSRVYTYLMSGDGVLPDNWLEGQLARVSKTTGDVDVLSQRLAHVRTWAYASHRSDWMHDPVYWQNRTREIEDQLSDALHERLMSRFLDKRTSALLKGLREQRDLEGGLNTQGEVVVEGHYVGRLSGLTFKADRAQGTLAQRAVANAAMKAVRPEVNRRLGQLASVNDDALSLDQSGQIHWQETPVGKLVPAADPLSPGVSLVGGDLGSPEAQARSERRLEAFVEGHVRKTLPALTSVRSMTGRAKNLTGLARGIAYRLGESFGLVPRHELADDIRQLSTQERRQLREAGIRLGEHSVYLPGQLKPAQARLCQFLQALSHGRDAKPVPEGRTSFKRSGSQPRTMLAAAGYMACGPLAVRADILERLADEIREARNQHEKRHFTPTPVMMNLLGCSLEDLRAVLRSLNYKRIKRGPDPEKPDGEIWGLRAGKPCKTVRQSSDVDLADTPFAVLAEMKLPDRHRKAKPRPGRKPDKRARKASGGQAK